MAESTSDVRVMTNLNELTIEGLEVEYSEDGLFVKPGRLFNPKKRLDLFSSFGVLYKNTGKVRLNPFNNGKSYVVIRAYPDKQYIRAAVVSELDENTDVLLAEVNITITLTDRRFE